MASEAGTPSAPFEPIDREFDAAIRREVERVQAACKDGLPLMGEREAEREMAEEDAALGAQDIADQVVLDAIDRAAQGPPNEAEGLVAEARRAADAYLAERLPASWRQATVAPCPIARARRREPRTRCASRRLRVRSGSRGDPPGSSDDDLATPRREAA